MIFLYNILRLITCCAYAYIGMWISLISRLYTSDYITLSTDTWKVYYSRNDFAMIDAMEFKISHFLLQVYKSVNKRQFDVTDGPCSEQVPQLICYLEIHSSIIHLSHLLQYIHIINESTQQLHSYHTLSQKICKFWEYKLDRQLAVTSPYSAFPHWLHVAYIRNMYIKGLISHKVDIKKSVKMSDIWVHLPGKGNTFY